MIDILIHEFGPNGSLNVIVGNEKIDATAVLEFLRIANYKFTFFVNSCLQKLGKREILKEDINIGIQDNINRFRMENLDIFKFIKCSEAFTSTFHVLSELHTICNELILCVDNYKAFVQ